MLCRYCITRMHACSAMLEEEELCTQSSAEQNTHAWRRSCVLHQSRTRMHGGGCSSSEYWRSSSVLRALQSRTELLPPQSTELLLLQSSVLLCRALRQLCSQDTALSACMRMYASACMHMRQVNRRVERCLRPHTVVA